MNRTERLLDLITYLLNARKPVSWQEIKNHFPEDYDRGVEDSNQRKFERDKAELVSLGIPIAFRSGREAQEGGYVVEKERLFVPEIEFNPNEASLLMLAAGAVLENQNFPYRDQLESALHKLTNLQGQASSPPPEISIDYSSGETQSTLSRWIRRIQDALDRRKTVELQYFAFTTGKKTRRKVNPYGLIFRKGRWTLVGWDHLRRDIRSFVLNRIEDLRINPAKPNSPDYRIPADFSVKDYLNLQPWQIRLHPKMRVKISVSPHRLPELLPQLAAAQRLDDTTFELEVTNKSGLISWILSQKSDSKILEPKSLQRQVRKILNGLQ